MFCTKHLERRVLGARHLSNHTLGGLAAFSDTGERDIMCIDCTQNAVVAVCEGFDELEKVGPLDTVAVLGLHVSLVRLPHLCRGLLACDARQVPA